MQMNFDLKNLDIENDKNKKNRLMSWEIIWMFTL